MNRWIVNFAIFAVSPVMALMHVLTRIRDVGSRNLIWIFCCYYGMAFYADMDAGSDGVGYIKRFQDMHLSDVTFESIRSLFYAEGESYFDLWSPVLTFVISRFTDDYRIFMGCVGFVYGYFFSRTLYFFVERLNLKTSLMEWYFVAVIAFTMDVGSGINSVRMYVAMFVFLSGVLWYYETGKTFFLVWTISSVLFHFSFALPIAILFLERFVRNVHFPIYLFFMASFITSEIELGFIRSIIEQVPGFASRVGGYISDGFVENRELTWLLSANRRAMKLFMMMTMTYFYFNNVQRNTSKYSGLFVFAMLMYGVVNLGGKVGSLLRFYSLAEIIALGLLLMHFNWYRHERQGVATVAAFAIPLTFLSLALGIRFFLGYASTTLVAGNPFLIWAMDGDVSLYEYVPRLW